MRETQLAHELGKWTPCHGS